MQKPANAQDEDAQLSKAIEMSITEAKDNKISLEPLNPEQRVRKPGVPVGLKNIGNSKYIITKPVISTPSFRPISKTFNLPDMCYHTKFQIDTEQIEKQNLERMK